jgi:hypothetical protein
MDDRKEKTFADTTGNRNGMILNVREDEASIGMHKQFDTIDLEFNAGAKMKRGAEAEIFDNNGGDSKADGAGVINKNGEYGPVTYGF